MLPILNLGPLAIQTPGLILTFGLWVGLTLSEKWAPRFEINPNTLYNLVFNALIAGLIGSRLVYVARYTSIFFENPLNLISVNSGLLDPPGGVAVGLIVMLIYGNRNQLSLRHTLDALTPILAVMLIAIGLSNFASGDGFGIETQMPWGISLWGATRHPSQLYESGYSILVLFFLWRQLNRENKSIVPGEIFLQLIGLSAFGRLFLETFRGDSYLIANFKLAQMIAWFILGASLWGLYQLKYRQINDKSNQLF